ncbi:hypothetical protein [Rhizobium leguminosarum]|uniref:hypothetical protein n=1 Tax=Rhizobium leguminosarum TaxID=384 RepID=UPI0021BBF803|nr:hypothetical protein [Rhizobium leguminosarum]
MRQILGGRVAVPRRNVIGNQKDGQESEENHVGREAGSRMPSSKKARYQREGHQCCELRDRVSSDMRKAQLEISAFDLFRNTLP